MKKRSATPTEDLGGIEDDREIRICGMVVQEKITTTKRGDRMAYLRVEDLTGSVEVIVFPDLYQVSAPLFQQDIPLLINGTLDRGEKGIKLKATAIFPLQQPSTERADLPEPDQEAAAKYTIRLSSEKVAPSNVGLLKEILIQFPGPLPVFLRVKISDGSGMPLESVIAVDPKFSVDGSRRLTAELEQQFGEGIVQTD
jgi:DNA polymerase-3 subunit alpha